MLILLRINLNYNLFGVPYNEDKLAHKKISPSFQLSIASKSLVMPNT